MRRINRATYLNYHISTRQVEQKYFYRPTINHFFYSSSLSRSFGAQCCISKVWIVIEKIPRILLYLGWANGHLFPGFRSE